MLIIKKLGWLLVGLVFGAIYLIIGLIAGVIFFLLSLVVSEQTAFGGVAALILLPLLYGVMASSAVLSWRHSITWLLRW